MSLKISSASKPFIAVPVAVTRGGIAYDPTGDTVTMAFPALGAEPTTFYAAAWETIGRVHRARCLVGPGSTVGALAPGTYDVYVKIVDMPEVPVLQAADNLLVT